MNKSTAAARMKVTLPKPTGNHGSEACIIHRAHSYQLSCHQPIAHIEHINVDWPALHTKNPLHRRAPDA
jgi:hypothetical protein